MEGLIIIMDVIKAETLNLNRKSRVSVRSYTNFEIRGIEKRRKKLYLKVSGFDVMSLR